MNSKFYMRTRIIMGTDCVAKNGELLKTLGKKALIVTGTQSAKKNGAEQDVISALESAGIAYTVFDKVKSNFGIACII